MNRRNLMKSGSTILVGGLLFGARPALARQQSTPATGQLSLQGILSSNVTSLPEAPAGEVAIVAVGPVLGRSAGFIAHNATNAAVGYGELQGIARDASGALAGVVDTDLAAPYAIEPGEYCIGFVGFDKELPSDTEIELDPTFETVGESFIEYLNLDVTEVSFADDRVIGVVENRTEQAASTLSHIVGLFLDPDGEIVGVTYTYVDASEIAPGGFSTFSTSLDGGGITDSYLFASTGWAI